MTKTLSEDDLIILEEMRPLVDAVGVALDQLSEAKQDFVSKISGVNAQLMYVLIQIYKAGRESKK
jgi:hypothetical protein